MRPDKNYHDSKGDVWSYSINVLFIQFELKRNRMFRVQREIKSRNHILEKCIIKH